MISSTNYFIKIIVSVTIVALVLPALCAEQGGGISAQSGDPRIAVFPVYNLSATPVPLDAIRQSLLERLQRRGIPALEDAAVMQFIQRHRLRYIGGIDSQTALKLKREIRAEAVLITTVELFSEPAPPKMSFWLRLVSTAQPPEILWNRGVGMAGDEDPGLFELSLVKEPRIILERILDRLADALAGYYAGEPMPSAEGRGKFEPLTVFRSSGFRLDPTSSVAIVPFLNFSERKHSDEIIALHFLDALHRKSHLTVLEPGVVRQSMLRSRVIMYDGLSLADTSALFNKLNADLILSGNILNYQDHQSRTGASKVGFSAHLFERVANEIVWAVNTIHQGDEGVFFFDWGEVNTAHNLASEMVALAVKSLEE